MPSPRDSPPSITASSTSSSACEKKPARQRPGAACLECRSKKLKCDGKPPQCGTCIASGTKCTPPATQIQRGPKRGHLKILQNKIDTLEQRLAESQNILVPNLESMGLRLDEPFPNPSDCLLDMSQAYLPSHMFLSTSPLGSPLNAPHDPMNAIYIPTNPTPEYESGTTSPTQASGLPESLESQSNHIISDLVRTDLNQLYFERVHHSVPILHRRNYFAWARSPIKTESQICLQYAIWTLAASLSSQLQDVRESLYQCTQKLLESLEWKDETFLSIEHVQARLLICIYELMRKNHQRGWMSAGRCFRLMQLMRLHEVDGPDNIAPSEENWVHQEERRRAFWMGYSLDLFISTRGKWPLTLHEYVTSTCLPVPEDKFQNGNYMEMPCLTSPTTSLDPSEGSPFTESIILASICRHLAVHRQRSAAEGIQGHAPQAFWDRHSWLDEMIKTRTGPLLVNYPTSLQHSDPMLLFTSMMAHAIILCLCNIMESVPCETPEYQDAVAAFRHRSLLAARKILTLSRSLAQLSYLKVHPFTPLPLRICADFFNAHRYLDESISPQVQEIYDSLREMGSVNNLAQDYLLA